MRVSERFPAFQQRSLLVIVDSRAARLLFASDREVREFVTVTVPESGERSEGGHSVMRGRGSVIIRGSEPERKKGVRFQRLLRTLSKTLLDTVAKERIATLYVFAPDQLLKATLASLHPSLKTLVSQSVPADFEHATARQIVERLIAERKRLPTHLKRRRIGE